ncbi:MAG: hypothetical protein FJ198_02745 [Gammaproteobacteria bacterium]|nr:hypothetical protein [Gammaproteobacteria bacterium]MBM4232853.1 hypothetical protein [Gammaproteobacteria bacterium]
MVVSNRAPRRAESARSLCRVWHRHSRHAAHTIIAGSAPRRRCFYRFIALDGSVSTTRRSRTLPQNDVQRFVLGPFSCSNIDFGWFTAYVHACERAYPDLIVRIGDYLYEYSISTYPTLK